MAVCLDQRVLSLDRVGAGAGGTLPIGNKLALFTIPLCVASVLGGMWISIRNRRIRQRTIVVALLLIAGGALAIASSASAGTAIVCAVVIGLFLAPLGTAYSLGLDDILPKSRRAEGFALLRTSNSIGVIVASATIALGTIAAPAAVAAVLAFLSAILIVVVHAARRR